ncbi:MAG: hypothetical protein ACR2IS_07120 [Nitrososphaeraceae archaeon]
MRVKRKMLALILSLVIFIGFTIIFPLWFMVANGSTSDIAVLEQEIPATNVTAPPGNMTMPEPTDYCFEGFRWIIPNYEENCLGEEKENKQTAGNIPANFDKNELSYNNSAYTTPTLSEIKTFNEARESNEKLIDELAKVLSCDMTSLCELVFGGHGIIKLEFSDGNEDSFRLDFIGLGQARELVENIEEVEVEAEPEEEKEDTNRDTRDERDNDPEPPIEDPQIEKPPIEEPTPPEDSEGEEEPFIPPPENNDGEF